MGTPNLEKSVVVIVRGLLAREGTLQEAVELMQTMSAGAGKNSAIAAICEHLIGKDNPQRAAELAKEMTQGAEKDTLVVRLCALEIGFEDAFALIAAMTVGPARDLVASAFIERCRGSGKKDYFISTAALYSVAQTRTQFFENLLADSVKAQDIEMIVRTYAALNRNPRKHEKPGVLSAAWASGDLGWATQACALCGRNSPTDGEKTTLAKAAVKAGRIGNALAVLKTVMQSEDKHGVCQQVVDAFGSDQDHPTNNTNETLDVVLQLPAAERPAAYEKMMAVCVNRGAYAVAYRVADALGRKFTNSEILAMLGACRERRDTSSSHLSLAEGMSDGAEKNQIITAMIPNLIAMGEIDAVKRAAELSGHKLGRQEVKTLVIRVLYRGAEAVAKALALLDGELTQAEAAEIFGAH